MRKFLVISLALLLVFSMSAIAFAEDDTASSVTTDTVTEESTDEAAVTDEAAATSDEATTAEAPFEIPAPGKVVVSSQALNLDGKLVDVQPYNIDGYNYFKLRDLAALMTGTGSQFDVTYEAPNMIVTTDKEYTPIDGDLVKGEDNSSTCVPSKQVLLVDDEKVDVLVYNIGGNNYFQLAGLGELVGFSVDYDAATRTIMVETASEEPTDGDAAADDKAADDKTNK